LNAAQQKQKGKVDLFIMAKTRKRSASLSQEQCSARRRLLEVIAQIAFKCSTRKKQKREPVRQPMGHPSQTGLTRNDPLQLWISS